MNRFLPTLGKKPKWAPWTAQETLFITWVGVNDCGLSANPEHALEQLFVTQERLYKAGARHFLFIDVPTIHRSAGGKFDHDYLERPV
uniref:Carbohydrate esterase family 16 protein n=1 Tax=Psilocybe cubensis TaxID=181762 RepID=A0A8H7Y5Z7_PSICU